jgi:acetyl esterase/lipase
MGTAQKPTKNSVKSARAPRKPAQAPKPSLWHAHRKSWLWLIGIFGGIAILALATVIAFRVSPWPGALFIRYFFDKGGQQTSQKLQKYVPSGISGIRNQQYRPKDKDAFLDVYYPTATPSNKALPTIVWVHGGAWVSGNKDSVANYLKILSGHGYTTVSVNYSIAPKKRYPTPVLQVNDALRYLDTHAGQLHIDPNDLALAGDSAGSQIAAQVGGLITNPAYARQLGMTAPIKSSQLKAMVLNCGAYDLALPNYNGTDGKFLKTVLWAYAGTKDFLHDPSIELASVVDYANGSFPPTFITAGNADPLEAQSHEFAGKLTSLGVPVSSLFYAKDHQPELQHEYQFNLDQADGKQALNRILAFLQDRLQ